MIGPLSRAIMSRHATLAAERPSQLLREASLVALAAFIFVLVLL